MDSEYEAVKSESSLAWLNNETPEEAGHDVYLVGSMQYEHAINKYATLIKDQFIFDSNGNEFKFGYIKGTVKEQGVPKAKTVMLFNSYGKLIFVTKSNKAGDFTFELLPLDLKYMITTLAGHEIDTPPEFHPDTVGYITPEAYKV